MRLPILALSLAAGLAAASAPAAQMMGPMAPMTMSPRPPATTIDGFGADGSSFPSQRERYVTEVLVLKAKMQRLTAADGGQLSQAHQVSLQKELDELNRRFGIRAAPHG